jgi:hypothetical protein
MPTLQKFLEMSNFWAQCGHGASQWVPDLGSLAQRDVMTAIPFNLEVVEITRKQDWWGGYAHFVRVRWVQ